MEQLQNSLTTGSVARITGVPQQTLIAWDRDGVLKAARPGRRASPRAPRRYDEEALAAALFAGQAMRMAFRGRLLRKMISVMQSGNKKTRASAGIFTYRTGPGMMAHNFSPDVHEPDAQRWIDHLRERGVLLGEPTTMQTLYEFFLPQARSLIRLGDNKVIDWVMETANE